MHNAKFVNFTFDSGIDLDAVPEGTRFSATWRMRNSGTTTWNANFDFRRIEFNDGGDQLTTQGNFKFSQVGSKETVPPGHEVDITLQLQVPAPRSKFYMTKWQLRSPNGTPFGQWVFVQVISIKAARTGFHNSDCKYIADHTIPDGTPIEEGTKFVKQWLVKNNGQRKWNDAYRLVFVNGTIELAGATTFRVPEADAGEEVLITVEMVSPPARDEPYISSWRLHDDRNVAFGEALWVKLFSTTKQTGSGVTHYSQNDPRWKHLNLGHGPRTFEEFGCLITCYAMMLSGFNEPMSPLELNEKIKKLPQFGFSGSEVFFIAPAKLIDHVKYWGNFTSHRAGVPFAGFDPNLIDKIDTFLGRGDAVLLQVDSEPTDPYHFETEQHWVLAIARQGNDYLVVDPIDGRSVSLLRKYGAQTRVQDAAAALNTAIKSALFYRSTQETQPGTIDNDGRSRIDSGTLTYTGPAWRFGHTLKGIHDRATRHSEPADIKIARQKFESVKIMSGASPAEANQYQSKFVLCRLFESWNGRHVPVEQFVQSVTPDIQPLIQTGTVEYFEFHNEPNLTHEGLIHDHSKGSWRNGAEFAHYFMEGRMLLRQKFPGIKVGFPGLSPGPATHYKFGHDQGFRRDSNAFFSEAQAAIREADFIGVHAYYVNMDEVRNTAIEEVRNVRRRWPDKLIFVSEYSNPAPNVSAREKGEQAREFMRLCAEIPGVGATYYFVISGPGWEHQALRREGTGESTGMIEHMF